MSRTDIAWMSATDLGRTDGAIGKSWHSFTFPFNLTRLPAASAPCGFTEEGLQAAYAFEQARPWRDRKPAIAGQI